MKPEFKNSTLETDYKLAEASADLSMEEKSKFWNKYHFTEKRMVLAVHCGYVQSLLEMADELCGQCDLEPVLDLTYKTLKHLPLVLGYQYIAYTHSNSYSRESALDISKKTFASYLTLLCMNEHMCVPEIEHIISIDDCLAGKESIPTWSGYSFKIGTEHKVDLLPEVGYSVLVTSNGRYMFRVSYIADLYKSMCGVDLLEQGLEDFACEVTEDGYFNIIENDSI